ncbi:MAG: hypothetical protein OEW75_06940, partial [Cyclobacteriaceae bacterium]|nr:hypothetical protein [Cyclobacteriaceae bacterium]
MKKFFFKLLDIEPAQATRVLLMLGMGFFMGIFLATLDVSASALFLQNFDEKTDLPLAILLSGAAGLIFTSIYNFFQSRIKYKTLAISTLALMTIVLFGVQIALERFTDTREVYRIIFILLLPLNYLTLLVFWGTFGRIFSLRESKKIIGSIDTGQLIASILALFSIPLLLQVMQAVDLLKISFVAASGVLLMLIVIAVKKLYNVSGQKRTERVSYARLMKSKYVVLMATFVIVSMIALSFVDFA